MKYLPLFISGSLTALICAGGWYVMNLRHTNVLLSTELKSLHAQVINCEEQIEDNSKHRDRINEINSLSIDDLRERAREWVPE